MIINVRDIIFSNNSDFVLIGGINVLEDKKSSIDIAKKYIDVCKELEIDLIFKASYDKANRSSINSYRGPGLLKGMEIYREIKR